MLHESLTEMLDVSKYCIEYRKDPKVWGATGCYGYPAAIQLFSIADSIGRHVYQTRNVRRHFNILDHQDFYNLNLGRNSISAIYTAYRCHLSHEAVIQTDFVLRLGDLTDPIYEIRGGNPHLNLLPWYEASVPAVDFFLTNIDNYL